MNPSMPILSLHQAHVIDCLRLHAWDTGPTKSTPALRLHGAFVYAKQGQDPLGLAKQLIACGVSSRAKQGQDPLGLAKRLVA
jgi:hypothetical protein